MKKYNIIGSTFGLLCAGVLVFVSCKKTDNNFNPSTATVTSKFFSLSTGTPTAVKKVAEALKEQNDTKEFINSFAKNEGIPVWDKSCITLVTPNSTNTTTTTGIFTPTAAIGDATPDTIVITPLVLDKADYVNGFILSKVSDSVSMTLYRNSDYQYLPFQTATPATYTTAEDFAIHMMAMDYNVFGHSSFIIKDKRLFNNCDNYKDTANVNRMINFGNNNGGTTINYAQMICVTITTTTTSNHCPYPPNQCPDIHTGVLGPCDNCQEYCANISTTYSTQCLSTGGGTGWPSFPPPPPPTGGGGSGGGGTGLPPCPGGGIPITNSVTPVNCNPIPNPWPSPTVCNPTLVSPQEQAFNEYVVMPNPTPVINNCPISNDGPDPISGTITWNVTEGAIANWQVKANTQYSYYHFKVFNIPANAILNEYDLFNYKTVSTYYVGSNLIVTSTWTQTSVTDQVINNNTSNTEGKSHVIGTLRHVQPLLGIDLPFCPKVLDVTYNVDNSMNLQPR